MARIGIALSGGGHRAALFGLGALLYLADAGKNREVTSISSVSGGSLTNAYVAQVGRYHEFEAQAFWGKMKAFTRQVALKGTLWASTFTWIYVIILVLSLAATFLSWLVPWPWMARLVLFLATLVVWQKAIAERRGEICGWALATTLFSQDKKPTLLKDIERRIDHVICATDLHAGEHVYFSGNFVYSYRFGWGKPGTLPLYVAVQASAAFPGAFPPPIIEDLTT